MQMELRFSSKVPHSQMSDMTEETLRWLEYFDALDEDVAAKEMLSRYVHGLMFHLCSNCMEA